MWYFHCLQTHSSIKQTEKKFNEQNFFPKENFFFKPVTPPEIENLINYLDTTETYKNCSWFFNSSDLLTFFTVAINKSSKIASAIPLDKGQPNKNEVSNYRPVYVLNTFSKFYEKIIKKQLVGIMEEYFSPLISAYRINYSSQHVIIRLLEEWRKKWHFRIRCCINWLVKRFWLPTAWSFNRKTCSIWPQWRSVDVYSILPFKS